MASPQRLNLERAMDQFRRELTDVQRAEISGANRMVVNHEIQKIQTTLGREKSLCRLGRMSRFLDTMEEIEKLVTIFLNVSEVVAFIWGPIKLVLMVAATWTTSVNNIIDVYEEIALALDNLAVFQNLIRDNEQLKRMLEDYFSDILRFHRCIVAVFSKPEWKRMFVFVWREFRRNIKPIIESMKRKQVMLSDDKLQQHAILKGIKDSDTYTKDQFEQLHSGLENILNSEQTRNQKQEKEEIKSSLEKKLNVSLPRITSQLELPEAVIETSGSWIFRNPLFRFWEADKSSTGSVLFLKGCPGAGKSTIARLIIRHINRKQSQESPSQFSLVYFFFNHNDADRRSIRSMLCQIITQITSTDDVTMRYAYDRCSSMDYLELSFLKALAVECLASQGNVIIVLDGLDEAIDNESVHVLKWCLYELIMMAPSRHLQVRLLICGQEDGRVEPLLSSYPQIRLDTADPHQKDIEEYSRAQSSHICSRFKLSTDEERDLIMKVTKAAKGMFLYAKVVLANLASMGSRKEFKIELKDNEFPRNLDEAYGRILQRVINTASPSAQASAKKILGWLVCSERPLRWREIQSKFCIDENMGTCDPDDLRADTCKQLCSSMVDTSDCEIFPGVESEQTITMVHETASKYLIYTGTIDLMEEHIDMALFCCRYLGSIPFFNTKTGQVKEAAESGYFGFMDYAAVYYESHVQQAESTTAHTDLSLTLGTARDSLSTLRDAYHSNALEITDELDSAAEHSEGSRESINRAIQDKVLDIRAFIDKHRHSLSQNTSFQDLQGPKRYNCPRINCNRFFLGYSTEAECQRHVVNHDRPFRCKDENCFAYTVGYVSQQELLRHNQTFHDDEAVSTTTFPRGTQPTKANFIHACQIGDLQKVKLLHRMSRNLLDNSLKKSSLIMACEAGHGHICKYLIDNGANPLGNENMMNEMVPLHLAIHNKNSHMLELFLVSCQKLGPFAAARLGNYILEILQDYPTGIDIVLRLLIARRPDGGSLLPQTIVATELATLFSIWGRKAYLPGVNESLSSKTSPIHQWFCQLFPKLYDHNGMFSPNTSSKEHEVYQEALHRDKQLLHDALRKERYELAMFLMDIDNENVLQVRDKSGNNLLHSFVDRPPARATLANLAIVMQRLLRLEGGKLPSTPNHRGELPVHVALWNELLPQLLQILLGCSSNVNWRDKEGRSPLHYVQSERSLRILLQYKKVDLFSRNNQGQTFFVSLFTRKGPIDENLARCLLQADMSLAWTADNSEQSYTPLHYAMELHKTSSQEPSSAVNFLLNLPEVGSILKAYSNCSIEQYNTLMDYVREQKLDYVSRKMRNISFRLLH